MPSAVHYWLKQQQITRMRTGHPPTRGERVMGALFPNRGIGWPGGWDQNRLEQVMHMKNWTYVAINAIAKKIGQLVPNFAYVRTQRVPGKTQKHLKALGTVVKPHEDLEPLEADHICRRLIENPNPMDTSFDLLYELDMFLELCGVGYLWAIPNRYGVPCELWVIPSHWVWPRTGRGLYVNPNDDKADSHLIDYYEIRPWGGVGSAGTLNFPADEVLMFPWKSPINKLAGYSSLSAVAQWIDSEESITKSRWAQFQNQARPELWLELGEGYADPDDATIARIEAKFMAKFQGEFNYGKPVITPPGAKLTPLGYNPTEMAYFQSEEQIRDMILSTFGVPKAVVGISNDMTYGSILATQASFCTFCINPRLAMLGLRLTKFLGARFSTPHEPIRIWWDDTSPPDPTQVNADLEADFRMGARTTNEIRAVRGYKPYAHGGDDPLVQGPGGLVPLPLNTGDDLTDLGELVPTLGQGGEQEEGEQMPGMEDMPGGGAPDEHTDGKLNAGDLNPNIEEANGKPTKSLMLKKGLTYLKQQKGEKHEYSSTQFNLPTDLAQVVQDYARETIPVEHLAASDGYEDEPHITVKYGLHTENPAAVMEVVRGQGPVKVTLGKTSLFETEEADVLKIEVKSPQLYVLNGLLSGSLENTTTYPYQPHVTLAYVQRGQGKQYAGDEFFAGVEMEFSQLLFCGRNEQKTPIPLGQREPMTKSVQKGEGGTCEQGETAANTGCTPASGGGAKRSGSQERGKVDSRVVGRLISLGKESGKEHTIVMDKEGKEVATSVGDEGTVDLSGTDALYQEGAGLKVAHNHPDNSMLSPQDLKAFVTYPGVDEITAVTHDGKIYTAHIASDRKELSRRVDEEMVKINTIIIDRLMDMDSPTPEDKQKLRRLKFDMMSSIAEKMHEEGLIRLTSTPWQSSGGQGKRAKRTVQKEASEEDMEDEPAAEEELTDDPEALADVLYAIYGNDLAEILGYNPKTQKCREGPNAGKPGPCPKGPKAGGGKQPDKKPGTAGKKVKVGSPEAVAEVDALLEKLKKNKRSVKPEELVGKLTNLTLPQLKKLAGDQKPPKGLKKAVVEWLAGMLRDAKKKPKPEPEDTKKPPTKPEPEDAGPKPMPDQKKPETPVPEAIAPKDDYSGTDTMGRIWKEGKVVGQEEPVDPAKFIPLEVPKAPLKLSSGEFKFPMTSQEALELVIAYKDSEYSHTAGPEGKANQKRIEAWLGVSLDPNEFAHKREQRLAEQIQRLRNKELNPKPIAKKIRENKELLGKVTELAHRLEGIDKKAKKELDDQMGQILGKWGRRDAFALHRVELNLKDKLKLATGSEAKQKIQGKLRELREDIKKYNQLREKKWNEKGISSQARFESVAKLLSSGVKSPAQVQITDTAPTVRAKEKEQIALASKALGTITSSTLQVPSYKVVQNRGRRASYVDADASVNFPEYTGAEVAAHEFAHGLEMRNPGVLAACREFLDYRLKGEKQVRLDSVFPSHGFGPYEMGAKDDFERVWGNGSSGAYYAGKTYSDATEILSMGVEQLFRDPAGFARKDPEYASFVIGVLNGTIINKT